MIIGLISIIEADAKPFIIPEELLNHVTTGPLIEISGKNDDDDDNDEKVVDTEFNIKVKHSTKTIKTFIELCELYVADPYIIKLEPIGEPIMNKYVPDSVANLIGKLNAEELEDIGNLADFLYVDPIVHTICLTYAVLAKTLSEDEMNKFFNKQ